MKKQWTISLKLKLFTSLLSILIALFLMLFSFDVFLDGGSTAFERLLGFIIHSIPTWSILTSVAIAWKYPQFGAWVFIVIGSVLSYIVFNANANNPDIWLIFLIIPLPVFGISALYFTINRLEKINK